MTTNASYEKICRLLVSELAKKLGIKNNVLVNILPRKSEASELKSSDVPVFSFMERKRCVLSNLTSDEAEELALYYRGDDRGIPEGKGYAIIYQGYGALGFPNNRSIFSIDVLHADERAHIWIQKGFPSVNPHRYKDFESPLYKKISALVAAFSKENTPAVRKAEKDVWRIRHGKKTDYRESEAACRDFVTVCIAREDLPVSIDRRRMVVTYMPEGPVFSAPEGVRK
jgi:hypothetical protein